MRVVVGADPYRVAGVLNVCGDLLWRNTPSHPLCRSSPGGRAYFISPCFTVTMPRPLGEVAPEETERAIAPQAHIICRLGGNIMAKPHHCAIGATSFAAGNVIPPACHPEQRPPEIPTRERVAALRFDSAALRSG